MLIIHKIPTPNTDAASKLSRKNHSNTLTIAMIEQDNITMDNSSQPLKNNAIQNSIAQNPINHLHIPSCLPLTLHPHCPQ